MSDIPLQNQMGEALRKIQALTDGFNKAVEVLNYLQENAITKDGIGDLRKQLFSDFSGEPKPEEKTLTMADLKAALDEQKKGFEEQLKTGLGDVLYHGQVESHRSRLASHLKGFESYTDDRLKNYDNPTGGVHRELFELMWRLKHGFRLTEQDYKRYSGEDSPLKSFDPENPKSYYSTISFRQKAQDPNANKAAPPNSQQPKPTAPIQTGKPPDGANGQGQQQNTAPTPPNLDASRSAYLESLAPPQQ